MPKIDGNIVSKGGRFISRLAKKSLARTHPTLFCAAWKVGKILTRERSRNLHVSRITRGLNIATTGDDSIFYCSTSRTGRYLNPNPTAAIERIGAKYCGEVITIDTTTTVIDVGANIGEFSMYAAARGARVFAIEPDPNPLRALKLNVRLLTNVSVFQLALADDSGSRDFFIASAEADSSLVIPHRAAKRVTTTTLTLVDFFQQNGLDSVDVVKMDAEGAEPEVLRGAIPIFDSIRSWSIDISPERFGESTESEVRMLLESGGYDITILNNVLIATKITSG